MNRKYFWVIPILCVAMYIAAFGAGRLLHGNRRPGPAPAQAVPPPARP